MTADQSQQKVVRKLHVEVIDARDLLPKDGAGSSSPYVVADFDGQRHRTTTKYRELNPTWNELLEFVVTDVDSMASDDLEIEVYNDKRFGNGAGRKNHFLGRVKISGSQFRPRGEEGIMYFALDKRSVFSWSRGEIGLKICYFDEVIDEQPSPPLPESPVSVPPLPIVTEPSYSPPPVVVVEETSHIEQPIEGIHSVAVRRMQANTEPRLVKRHFHDEFSPKVIPERVNSGRYENSAEKQSIPQKRVSVKEAQRPYGLVDPMQYLFVRIVKARGLASPCESPYVKIRTSSHLLRSKPAVPRRPGIDPPDGNEWNQVFALSSSPSHPLASGTLEISIWESDKFLGGVCFDLFDVPVRDPPDCPLAPQWYRLESSSPSPQPPDAVTGEVQLSVWIGTQADEAFSDAYCTDAVQPHESYTRSKVYQSPKLWYLRVTVVEAQDLDTVPTVSPEIRVKGQLGFQSVRTRRGVVNHNAASVRWNEDLVFVAAEPLEDLLILIIEDRTGKDTVVLGHVSFSMSSVEQRMDDRHVPSKWLSMEGGEGNAAFCGRILVRLCLEGGYHVLDEAAHVCSDFRPTAKQLWKPPVGVLELGILGARGLLPMKTKGSGKGSTDAYCVAKYGKKWVRTRTVTDSFDPRWNEQYTWQVFDPCTVITIGVFDNWRMLSDVAEEKPDCRIGKIRIRVSTLESNKVYTSSYPLLAIMRTGLKKMGEIELAVRFVCPNLLPETCSVYGQPMLPKIHYVRPLGVAQQEALRGAATRMVASWLARSEPPLGPEVVRYMLDADSHSWSMRKSKANWFRIVGVLAWAVGFAKWLNDIRQWRNPVTTILVHVLFLVLVWFPDLIVPTAFLYVFLIGLWYYRFRPRVPAGMDVRLSQADTVDPDELDEEFDPIPSSKSAEVIRARYDRLRILAARVQTVLGDFATQGERVQALVSWRDPRATKLFMGVCLIITIVLYLIPAKMVAVAIGFYFLRHPMFRNPLPAPTLNFFRRLPSLSDRLM